MTLTFDESLKRCFVEVEACLGTDALSKGYALGTEDRREAFRTAERDFKGHAAGEIYYKALRLQRLGNTKDAIKIMAWAFLLWDSIMQGENKPQELPAETHEFMGTMPESVKEAAAYPNTQRSREQWKEQIKKEHATRPRDAKYGMFFCDACAMMHG